MYIEMRVNSYLKGLAETRARVDADYQTALTALTYRTDFLARVKTEFDYKCAALQRTIRQAQDQAQVALRAREACDQLIARLEQGIDPTLIEPINGWQGRYGQRGALGHAVQATVEAAYPLSVTTPVISQVVQNQFRLTFEMPAERREWVRVSVLGRLNYLCRLGLVERLHDPQGYKGEVGQWRAIPPNAMANDLVKLASQACIPLTFFAEEVPIPPDTPEEDDLPR